MSAWKHDDLLADLAGHLRGPDRMVWTDMQLGPSGSPRPDIYTLQKSYSKPLPTAYEIKISRSDLRSDTTSGKWQNYLKFAGSVTFAVPDGLCSVADIPDGCGLIVRKAETWRYARRPTIQKVDIPRDAWMKLLIDGVGRLFDRPLPRSRCIETWQENASVRKKFGAAVEKAARDLLSVESLVASIKDYAAREYKLVDIEIAAHKLKQIEHAKTQVAEYEAAKRDLCTWLGIDEGSSIHIVRRRISEMRRDCDADARVKAADEMLRHARNAIEMAAHALRPPEAPRAPWEQAA